MDRPRLYLETSVLSYLAARPSRDLVVAAHQQITLEWWEKEMPHFEVFASELVYLEAERGSPDAAQKRLNILEPLKILKDAQGIREIAERYVKDIPLPRQAGADAMHLAFAAWYEMDYLMTWNCRHIANGRVRKRLEELNRALNVVCPTICTPEELLYGIDNME